MNDARQLLDRPSIDNVEDQIHCQKRLPVNFRSDRQVLPSVFLKFSSNIPDEERAKEQLIKIVSGQSCNKKSWDDFAIKNLGTIL